MDTSVLPRFRGIPCESRCHITLLYIQRQRHCLESCQRAARNSDRRRALAICGEPARPSRAGEMAGRAAAFDALDDVLRRRKGSLGCLPSTADETWFNKMLRSLILVDASCPPRLDCRPGTLPSPPMASLMEP
jgi:hypothetical protein